MIKIEFGAMAPILSKQFQIYGKFFESDKWERWDGYYDSLVDLYVGGLLTGASVDIAMKKLIRRIEKEMKRQAGA